MPQDAPSIANDQVETDLQPPAPYEQQVGESPTHFGWFTAFLEMGPSRSLLGAQKNFYQKSGKVWTNTDASPAFKATSRKWNWRGRVGAWDRLQREERLRLIREREKLVIDKIFASVEKQLERSEKVDKFADFVLTYPRTQQTTIDGQTVIEPGKWNFMTGIRAFLAAGESNKTAVEVLGLLGTMERGAALREMAGEDASLVLQARQTLEAFGYTVAEPEAELIAGPDAAMMLSPTQLREKENARLDVLETLAAAQVQAGVPGAMERAIRIAQRRANLNGLDKPFDPGSEETRKKRRDMSSYSDIELAILEEMLKEEDN